MDDLQYGYDFFTFSRAYLGILLNFDRVSDAYLVRTLGHFCCLTKFRKGRGVERTPKSTQNLRLEV